VAVKDADVHSLDELRAARRAAVIRDDNEGVSDMMRRLTKEELYRFDGTPLLIRKAYHLFCLLSGVRPGEGARLRWSNVRDNEQSFTIPTAKAGKDIVLPASPDIMAGLRMAREATYKGHHEVKIADLVFPAAPRLAHGRRCQRVETNSATRTEQSAPIWRLTT
jgi:integrase